MNKHEGELSMTPWLNIFRTLLMIAAGAALALALAPRETHDPTTGINTLPPNEFRSEIKNLQQQLKQLEVNFSSLQQQEAEMLANLKLELDKVKQQLATATRSNSNKIHAAQDEHSLALLEMQQESEAENGYAMRVDESYFNETRDESWAAQQEVAIENILRNNQMFEQLQLEDIQCRSTSCKLRIERRGDTPPHAEQVLLGQLGRDLPYAAWSESENHIELTLSQQDLGSR